MTDNRTTELRISEQLRGFIKHQSNRAYIDGGQARWLTEIADEIEAEIESRYMLLPVDADGVPIHVGDELRGYGFPDSGAIVKALNGTMVIVGRLEGGENYAKSGLLWSASETRHVKPRTLEDMMTEYEELAANQNVKDYFKVSKELRTIQSEQFMDEPELELYKEVNGYRFYIELPYDELWIMTDKVEVKHHSYSYRYKCPNGNTVMSCSSLCGFPREWAIERLDKEIEKIREMVEVDE